jgi:hypothetical protein
MAKGSKTPARDDAVVTGTAPRLSLVLRILNVLGAILCLASALAVLTSNVLDPAYRAHYRDAWWFVVLYAAFYGWVLRAFASARQVRLAQALAVAKAVGTYVFLVAFPAVGRSWMVWTPGRYVYQLFDWGPDATVVLMAYVFLLRGAWNTINAFALTRDVWFPLRTSRPLVGRLVTIVPVAITVSCIWAFLALARMNAAEFSPEAHEIAVYVAGSATCDEIRAKTGTTTTDVRQRGDRRYDVRIRWDCTDLRVIVRDQDGRAGTARTPRPECC